MCVCVYEEAWLPVCTPVAAECVRPPPPQGAFSRCYKLVDMSTGAVFALKVVPRAGAGAGQLRPRSKVGPDLLCPGGPTLCRGSPERSLPWAGGVMPLSTRGRGHVGPRLQVDREIALHSHLEHRNIVALHGYFADREHVYMVLEYCSRQVPPPPLLCSSGSTSVSLRTYLAPAVSTPGPSVLMLLHLRPPLLS